MSTPLHSWKWLAPRLTSGSQLRRRGRGGSAEAVARPCLAIEPLDERVLLSAAPGDTVIGKPPSGDLGDSQVLVELLKHSAKISETQIELFKTLSPVPVPYPNLQDITITQTINKATPLLFQLDDELFKFGQDVITGQLTEKKVNESASKVDYLIVKMEEVLISSVTSESQQGKLLFLLDTLKVDVLDGMQKLPLIPGAGTASQQNTLQFVSLADDFSKVEDLLFRADLDFVKAGSPGVDLLDFKGKIDIVLAKASEKIAKFEDSTIKATLFDSLSVYQTNVNHLLGSLSGVGGDIDEDGGGGVGILLPEPTDDLIL